MNKQQLRELFRSKVRSLSDIERLDASIKANSFLEKDYSFFDCVGCFCPLRYEPDIKAFNNLMAKKKCLALPRVDGQDLAFYLVTKPEEELILSPKNIWEPSQALCQRVDPKILSVLILPGLAFDEKGYRLGYGGGFYDRFLANYPETKTVGIAFSAQMLSEALPLEKHDRPIQNVRFF